MWAKAEKKVASVVDVKPVRPYSSQPLIDISQRSNTGLCIPYNCDSGYDKDSGFHVPDYNKSYLRPVSFSKGAKETSANGRDPNGSDPSW